MMYQLRGHDLMIHSLHIYAKFLNTCLQFNLLINKRLYLTYKVISNKLLHNHSFLITGNGQYSEVYTPVTTAIKR